MNVRAAAGLLLVLSLLLGTTLPARAQRLAVEAPASLQPVAERLRSLDPVQIEGAARLVGLEESGAPIRVVLAAEGSAEALSAPSWVAGYALPERGVVVLLPARSPRYPDSSLEDLLRHEVAHVLVARASAFRPLPRWFHEGVAMIAGLAWGLEEQSRLAATLLRSGEVPMAVVDHRFAGGEGEVRSAYTLAGAFVRDLLRQHGREVVGAILANVAAGLSFEEAFARSTGTPLGAAESDFWERQTFWYRWVPFLSSSVVLWLLITLLALWAMKRRRARDAARLAAWEAQEEAAAAAAAAIAAATDGDSDPPLVN
jgi:hypothetical protein